MAVIDTAGTVIIPDWVDTAKKDGSYGRTRFLAGWVMVMFVLAKEQLQILLHCGTALIAAAAVAAAVCIVVFTITGKKIKKELEHDYGNLEH